jgi:pyridoxamine 5'-phosphate oxidase
LNDDTNLKVKQARIPSDPVRLLAGWLDEAREAGVAAPKAMTLATAAGDGSPSARVVSLKRLEGGALVFTTGLWTRKARELRANPAVAAVFHWPGLGRQVRVEGRAEIAERELAEELFAARPRSHRLQTLVSRQGEAIDDLGSLRERLGALAVETGGHPLPCPEDWGAVRIRPARIEFWREGEDRLHERLLFESVAGEWRRSRLAP